MTNEKSRSSFLLLILVLLPIGCEDAGAIQRERAEREKEDLEFVEQHRLHIATLIAADDLFFPTKSREQYGVVDKNGNVLIPPSCGIMSIGSDKWFTHGSETTGQKGGVLMRNQYRWDYVGSYGSRSIPAPTQLARRFYNFGDSLFGVVARIDDRFERDDFGYVIDSVYDPSDQWQPPPGILPRRPLSEGLVVVQNASGLGGYADRQGNIVIAPQYDFCESFFDGLAGVRVDGLRGYIDKSGAMVIDPQYTFASSFDQGLAIVKNDEIPDGIVINKKGEKVFDCTYDLREGTRNKTGQIVGFRGGLRAHYKAIPNDDPASGDRWLYGFIRPDGSWQFEPVFRRYSGDPSHGRGRMIVVVDEPGGDFTKPGAYIIDRDGNTVCKIRNNWGYNSWSQFHHGLAYDESGEFGYMNEDGEIVWRPKR